MARKAPTKLARLMKTGLLVLFIIAASVGATLYYSLQQSCRAGWRASRP
jgi:flagellar FliL protein